MTIPLHGGCMNHLYPYAKLRKCMRNASLINSNFGGYFGHFMVLFAYFPANTVLKTPCNGWFQDILIYDDKSKDMPAGSRGIAGNCAALVIVLCIVRVVDVFVIIIVLYYHNVIISIFNKIYCFY